MLEAFLAVFALAFVFTLYAFIILEKDMKSKSDRVIYILIFAIVAWPVSLSLLIAPTTVQLNMTTTNVPLVCAINPSNTLTANVPTSISCGTTTQTSVTTETIGQPFPTFAFATYSLISLGIALFLSLILVQYMLEYGIDIFLEGLKSLISLKKKR